MMLTAAYSEYELRFGDGNGLTGIADSFLWNSVACHYAGGCDANSNFVQLCNWTVLCISAAMWCRMTNFYRNSNAIY